MCGIAGIIQTDPSQYSKEHLKKMTDALAHRGPDGEACWANNSNNALLGHRRLSIIDLSEAAAQPMHYMDRYSIVHNGEIYNYIELRKELEKEGYSFRTQSDTEVILAAYDHWDDECVEHFDGMFAFAIWDEKEKELFAARDRFGEKPFFYCYDGTNFLFASEMKALWSVGISRQPNRQMLFNFITIGYVDNPARPEETFYTNIFKLPPASRLYYSIKDKELYIEKFWDIDMNNRNKKITDKEAIEQFDHLFRTSISRRLRSDVAIGTSLSGGLDSSSIVAWANELQPMGQAPDHQQNAFSAIFPGFEKDESSFINKVTDKFHLHSSTVLINADDLINDWEKICYHQEEPFGSASIYMQYKVFELAKQHNVTVLLDGQGADETLAGYHKYYKWYWQELFTKRKLVSSGELKAARKLGIEEDFGVKNIIASLFPDLASVILERQYLIKALRQDDLTKDFVKMQSKEAYYSTPAHFNLNGALYFNCCLHGLEELLRYADRNSMANGREVRLPFLSHELVEFIFSLPSHFKIRQGWTKWLLRSAMQDKLPAAITWRKDKVGFEPPQQQWMQHSKLQEAIQEAKSKMVKEKILKPAVLDKPVVPLSSHAADNYDWRYLAAAPFIG
ncbi:MAG TPA: asparagine synthase (glutamine-hydrolyzing) [Chitinophagaceae bacterium]